MGRHKFQGALVFVNEHIDQRPGDITPLRFGGVTYDYGDFHNEVTAPSRFTIPKHVDKVIVKGQVVFDADATGHRRVIIFKNGDNHYDGSAQVRCTNPSSDSMLFMQVSTPVIEVVEGDYFELTPYHTSDVSLNIYSGGEHYTWFSIESV